MADTYRIQNGDTLGALSAHFNVPMERLAEVNGIKNVNKIRAGAVLTIPDLNPPTQATPPAPPPKPVQEVGRIEPYTYNASKAIPVEVVQPPSTPSSNQPVSSGATPPTAEAWGPGHSKSYPPLTGEPGSIERLKSQYEQMKYGEFWADFLDKALPTAIQAAGPGEAMGLIRGAVALRDMAQKYEFHKLPQADDPMAKWLFKNMRQRANTQDPNYGAIFRPGERGTPGGPGSPKGPTRPLAMDNKILAKDQYPGFNEFSQAVVNEVFGFDVTAQTTAHETATIPASVINSTRLQQKQLMDEAAALPPEDRNVTVVPKNTTTVAKTTPGLPEKTTTEKAFLGFTNAIEPTLKTEEGGTALRLFNDFIQRGRKTPVTESDFSSNQLQGYKQIILAHSEKTGAKTGKIDYKDYAPAGTKLVDSNIIGGFRYKINKDGSVDIIDTYDFNVDRGGEGADVIRNYAAALGRKYLPSTKGGYPVKIHID